MKCPHCRKELEIPERVYHNAEAYGGANTSVTDCCGKLVQVYPVNSIRVEAIRECELGGEEHEEDSWGISTWGYKRDKNEKV